MEQIGVLNSAWDISVRHETRPAPIRGAGLVSLLDRHVIRRLADAQPSKAIAANHQEELGAAGVVLQVRGSSAE